MMKLKLKFKSQTFYLLIIHILLISGCSSIAKIENKAVSQLSEVDNRYSAIEHSRTHDMRETLFVLAFSGGGTRAAALSYGVLEELRDTQFQYKGNQLRLLDEVDKISSVSGGSFTSAYYGLFGDQIFDNYKDVFLYRDIQGELSGTLGIFNVIGRTLSTTSRIEKAIDYYDKQIFQGKTFADLANSTGPYILINATDLNSRSQFVFVQNQFDFLCSDLSHFKIARAVAASSAVPILFPPVLIKKHKGCHLQRPEWLTDAAYRAEEENDKRLQDTVDSLDFYLDDNNPPYVTLLDGGISDNLGLKTILRIEGVSQFVNKKYKTKYKTQTIPKRMVVISVDASTKSETDIGKDTVMPSLGDVLSTVTDIQLHLYNTETNSLMKQNLKEWAKKLSTKEHPVSSYFIELDVTGIKNKEDRDRFNKIPTSFSLEKEQVDMLIDTARNLLRENPEYNRLLNDLGAAVNNI